MAGLVQEGFVWGWGELSKIHWKEVEQKRVEGQAGSSSQCLKKGGAGTPLRNMSLSDLSVGFVFWSLENQVGTMVDPFNKCTAPLQRSEALNYINSSFTITN